MANLIDFNASTFQKAESFLKGKYDDRIIFGNWENMEDSELQIHLFSSLASGGTRGEIMDAFVSSRAVKRIVEEQDMTLEELSELLKNCKIRFPNQKAKRLIAIRRFEIKKTLLDLATFSGKDLRHERWSRLVIKNELPGMGLKEVSNFLKWIGFSQHLSVLDSVNLKFLKWTNAIPGMQPRLSDIKTYYLLEDWENALARRLEITVSQLDNLIIFLWYRKYHKLSVS